MWRVWHNVRVASTKSTFNTMFRAISNTCIDINEEVRHALEHKKPIVALESTIITHGMPFPKNLECAMDVETIVQQRGATPATVAILGGRIKVGLNAAELAQLADTGKVEAVKTSRRDFGYVIANKCNGGTTVAGTLIVATEVGIRTFATGVAGNINLNRLYGDIVATPTLTYDEPVEVPDGIGGVHRGGEQTFDISADLTELGKSPVAVVSSGVKSILDVPKTLEYLETQGVFVATFGGNKAFPAFYCRASGCEAPHTVRGAKEAADIIRCHLELGLQSGLLFAVPVPEEFAMNEEEMNAAIERAMASAKKCGVSGKQITPYLLAHIAEMTAGSSLKTNIALIQNNARVAADIAVELVNLDGSAQNQRFGGTKGIENPPH